MTDRIDERLSAAARQWQAEQASPPGVPMDRLEEPLSRPAPWRAVAAAAAAVVLVGGAAVALTRSDGDRTVGPSTESPTATVPQAAGPAIPWRNLPAGHPDVRHHHHGQVVTPFDRVSATGTISGDAHPGDVLTFTAVLESSITLRLDPCPDFNIAFGKSYWHTWQLNCAQVPYHDGHGRPVLPAFKNVRFEMKVTVPDEPGKQKVLWTLDGPQQMPGFYGIVNVERP
jgi:hypothetical protein